MLIRLAQDAPDVDVSKIAPAISARFGNTYEDINAAIELQKGVNTARKKQEAEAQTLGGANAAASTLTNPLVAPELTLPQVLSQLRAVEAAGALQPPQVGPQWPAGTAAPAESLLNQLDIMRTESQVKQREQVRVEADANARALIAEAKELRKERFTNENQLRDEFVNQARPFVIQRDAFDRIQASSEDPSGAGDIAMIFSFMKVLDPNSSVREGEYANADNSGGVPGTVTTLYNRLLGNPQGRLSETQRDDFLNRSKKLFRTAVGNHKALEAEYKGLAKRNALNPRNAVPDMVKRGGARVPAMPTPSGMMFSHYHEQTGNPVYTNPQGEYFEDVPDGEEP